MKRFAFAGVLAALWLAYAPGAEAVCGCPSGGVPRISSAVMKGNDLNEVRGDCTVGGNTVELQVRQQHFYRKSSLPLNLGGPFEAACINGCIGATLVL